MLNDTIWLSFCVFCVCVQHAIVFHFFVVFHFCHYCLVRCFDRMKKLLAWQVLFLNSILVYISLHLHLFILPEIFQDKNKITELLASSNTKGLSNTFGLLQEGRQRTLFFVLFGKRSACHVSFSLIAYATYVFHLNLFT